jgi:hypothetical protein
MPSKFGKWKTKPIEPSKDVEVDIKALIKLFRCVACGSKATAKQTRKK